ncbi:NAD(P)H-quinone oxidoreductase [Acuticoccus sediminis]|nr:NAD(P)H-quinone oxidoreductase [Acuticoccus sediminis]
MSIPTTMRAVTAPSPGGPDVLEVGEFAVPKVESGEILIKVEAAGVNRPDCLQRAGNYPPPPGAGPILGLEVAGEVVHTGGAATRFAVGDKVMALVVAGGYAEYVAVPETTALPIPDGLSMEEAAGIPETYFTVWSNVFDRGGLRAGETFLVHGGTSGIGTTAIQLAKAFGATVITTAGSDEKCAACLELGADRAINYQKEDFVAAIKDFAPGGVHLTLDMVGGDYVVKNWKVAAVEGRIVQIATLNGPSEANFSLLMMKRLVHTGSTLRAREVPFKAEIARKLEDEVFPLFADGRTRVVMDRTFPLGEAAEAHRRMEGSSHIGKIVLVP